MLKKFFAWVAKVTGGNGVKISTPSDNGGNSWEQGEIKQVEKTTNDTGILATVLVAVGAGNVIKSKGMNDFWESLANNTLNAAEKFVGNKQTQQTNVATAKINSDAVVNGIKALAFPVIGFVLAMLAGKFVVSLFKSR